MATTLLEQTRALHEDLERAERLIVKDFNQDIKGHKDKLMQSHRVRKRLDTMQEVARKLVKIYDDDDSARKEEVAALGGEGFNVYSKFYDRLKEVKDYYKRHPIHHITEAENDDALVKEEPAVEFTGEESLGRYLDLHEHHRRFLDFKLGGSGGQPLEYAAYITLFADFSKIPRTQKFAKPYRDYLDKLLAYLQSFYERSQPLSQMQMQRNMKKLTEDFQASWQAGQVGGWEDRGHGQMHNTKLLGELQEIDSAEDMELLFGAERLKEMLQQLGLKCGGTPRQRAERLFLVKTTPLERLDRKLFAKGAAPQQLLPADQRRKVEAAAQGLALNEAKVVKYAEVLTNVISDTLGRVEKKMAQTYEELQAEMEEAEAEIHAGEEDSDEEEHIYNPLKLPLGWDGKPIPYWLYKLHGLNQEFTCEICGNHSYWGRRAFEKHFREWRHQNGMRALGIPNNKNFFEVTKIEEARELWRSMQSRDAGGWNPETDEEFEDARGNTYGRKMYDDLRRQGLLD